MKVVTAEEMREIDRITIEEYGFPGNVLMGIAGKSAADYIMREYPNCRKIAVFAGTGNNGGDGFVMAHFLTCWKRDVDIYVTGSPDRLSPSASVYAGLCKGTGISIIEVDEEAAKKIHASEYDLLVDAMLGTGFSGRVRGAVKEIISLINETERPVLAVDLPSGLPSNGEPPEGDVVFADCTVTMGLPKISTVTFPGKKYCGHVEISDIGFPPVLTEDSRLTVELFNNEKFSKLYPSDADPDVHKGDNGHLLLIGGFDGMEGAIMLSALAALETGTGLVSLLTTCESRNIIAGKIPELMTGSFDKNAGQEEIAEKISSREYNALVIGPGMGRNAFSSDVFKKIMILLPQTNIRRVLIDGDGLFLLADYLRNGFLPSGIDFVLTPHFKEASRLIGKSVAEIKKSRLAACRETAEKTSSTVVLKGPASITTGDGISYINTTGNPALATGGSGDVLSGIIGSFLAKGQLPVISAAMGVYIHGRAADLFCSLNRENIMKAGNIIGCIRKVTDV